MPTAPITDCLFLWTSGVEKRPKITISILKPQTILSLGMTIVFKSISFYQQSTHFLKVFAHNV